MNEAELKKEIHELTRKVDMMLTLLKSNPEFKQEGLVEQVNRMDAQLDKLTNKLDMLWFKLAWIAFIGGALMQILWLFLSKLFNQ